MTDKAKVVDALLFRRVNCGDDRATLSIEPSPEDGNLYDVFIETRQGTQHDEARFDSIQKAVEFFDWATERLANDNKALAAFDMRKETRQFFSLH